MRCLVAIAVAVLVVAVVAAVAQGANLVKILYDAGFRGKNLQIAYGIAMRESGGRADAYNPKRETGDDSYGLFQINMLGDMGPSRRKFFGIDSNEALLDPVVNAAAAFKLSKKGRDFGAWGIGPNAYREGAGMDTIQEYIDAFPGLGKARAGKSPGGSRKPFDVSSPEVSGGGQGPEGYEWLTSANRMKLQSIFADDPEFLALVDAIPSHVPADEMHRDEHGHQTRTPQSRKWRGKVYAPGASWKGTHVTDGLDWNNGKKTAQDIMLKPGTPVGAPEAGTIVRWGSAQGGQALYFRGKSGRMYWLGHIEDMLPVGTKVKAGQPIAVISADHPRPHLHIDRKL